MDLPLTLYRIDPGRNMRRYYSLSLQPSLFGDIALVRHWGRLGTTGQQIVELHDGQGAALKALQKLADAKRRRGYRANQTVAKS